MSDTPEHAISIHRREAIMRVAALMGGTALVGGGALIAACGKERAPAQTGVGLFTADDVALLDDVAETILPQTKTPGAKAAQVGAFMALMVTDTYDARDRAIFRAGMLRLDEASKQANGGASFVSATPEQRLALLEKLDREQKEFQDAKKDDERPHYFRMMKQLTLVGYFTSEIGCTQALRYRETPGRFDPCVPYTEGETIWAGHA